MMAGSGTSADSVAGGPARHVPVLVEEVMRFLGPAAPDLFIDATFGAGGYSRAIMATGAAVVAIDRDATAIAAGADLKSEFGDRLTLVEGCFADLDVIAREHGHERVNGVVLDVGVSSMQLDDAARGFSFRGNGPLDMRMGGEGPSAADVVNAMDTRALARVIAVLGEEKRARAVATAIAATRKHRRITHTSELADIVAKAVGWRASDPIHPATRTFQALRIFVNRELDELADGLAASERILSEGARLVVVSFHSLEDRIVKRFLTGRSTARPSVSRHRPEVALVEPTFALLTRGAMTPGEAEIRINPRARSARLRAARRTAAPSLPLDRTAVGVPALPEFAVEGMKT
jgi:16S rRNA (cytosine1402-N4)-methyltransferase